MVVFELNSKGTVGMFSRLLEPQVCLGKAGVTVHQEHSDCGPGGLQGPYNFFKNSECKTVYKNTDMSFVFFTLMGV